MLKKLSILIISITTYSQFLHGDPSLPGVVASTDGDPGAIIAGCVNAITGDFILSKQDLVIRGAVPLVLKRSYISGNGKGHDNGWEFIPHFVMESYYDQGHQLIRINVAEASGTKMHYASFVKSGQWIEISPVITKHAVGLANNSSSVISGRTNIKNTRVFYKHQTKRVSKHENSLEIEAYVVTSDGLRRYYKKCRSLREKRGFQLVLYKEQMPNGCWILYESDDHARPTLAKVVSPDETKTFAWAKFHYHGHATHNHNFNVETSDGQTLRCVFGRRGGKKENFRFYLQDVDGSLPSSEHYVAAAPPKKFNSLLTELWQGGRLQQKISYHYPNRSEGVVGDDHPACNRVKELYRTMGPNNDLIRTHKFSYNVGNWRDDLHGFDRDGATTIEGADGYKVELHWSRELRPLRIYHYDTTISSKPKMVHHLIWGAENSKEIADLKGRVLLDADGQLVQARTIIYDDHFNPIRENFHGNLTGTHQGTIRFDKEGKIHGGESYGHTYVHSKDGQHLILEDREDNGTVARFQYMPGTSLLTAHFISFEHVVLQRHFYEYDQDHLLIAEIVDDGCSDEPNNLHNVKTRQIKHILRRSDGLPERIEERYFDPSSRQEKMLKAIVLHYSPQLLVTKQDVLNADGDISHSLHTEYDAVGRMIAHSDPLGRWTRYSYDDLGRCCRIEDPSGLVETISTCDTSGCPLHVEERTLDGLKSSQRHFYNSHGVKAATVDHYGHVTRYHPDPWGRTKKIEYQNGSSEHCEYDAMGCPIKQISRSGAIVHARYNAYGKPIEIHHPDGSTEHHIYNLNGTLKESTDKLGAHTCYTYDSFGRITHTQVFDRQSFLLTEEHRVYTASQLTQHIDGEGNATHYEYDGAGRKTAEHKNGSSTHFEYDSLGRLRLTCTELWKQEFSYDLLDRITCERTLTHDNRIQREVSYAYDARGNRCETSLSTSQGKASHHTLYDSLNRLITTVDPTGVTTHITYDESTPGTLRKITVDALGTKTTETFGSMGETVSLEVVSMMGEQHHLEEFTYDLAGNCISHKSHLPRGIAITSREFDTMGNLLVHTEAAGCPEQKVTRYQHATGNLLEKLFKNDGTVLHHEYDALGRMTLCQDACGEGYRYTYDKLNRVKHVQDIATGRVSTRTYGISGHITEEGFLHGLTISYSHDKRGRPTKMHLPDYSSIAYHWDGIHLKEISRLSHDHHIRYTHRYEEHDLAGWPKVSKLIADQGHEERTYDLAGRLNTCKTLWHQIQASARNPTGHLLRVESSFPMFDDEHHYDYDPLQQLQEEKGTHFCHTFAFDPHSTLLSRDSQETTTNKLYQLVKVGHQHYAYDPVGRLSRD